MLRELELAFARLHILHHAEREEVFGVGLMRELSRHGYEIGAGTMYPTLAKLGKGGYLTCRVCTVNHRQRKYYRITSKGSGLLGQMRDRIKELYAEVIEQP